MALTQWVLLTKASVHLWDAEGMVEVEEVNPPRMGYELSLVTERCCFFAFLLPGINNRCTVEAILQMYFFFFPGTTAEQNGGKPNCGHL